MRQLFFALPILALTACSGGETDSSATSAAPVSQNTAPAQSAATEMSLEQRGSIIYKRCRACHTLGQGERHKVGPNLWAVYGRQAGTVEGYAYSKAMKASDIVWDTDSMDAYLKRPSDYVPGGKMSFIGLKKQEDRDAVQAYLRAQTTP